MGAVGTDVNSPHQRRPIRSPPPLRRRRHRHRTTTSVEPTTSSKDTANAEQPMIEKLTAMRLHGMITALNRHGQ
jgi:hypothetical protein